MKCFGEKPKNYHCKIVFLDETELLQEIQSTIVGQELLDVAFKHLNLLETAYFGLRYIDSTNQTHWLDPSKKAARQLNGTDPFTLYFGVKFYASDPCKLLEEITRYQFFLQVKQDVLQGRLPVAFDLAAELGAYAVQSELGDYDPRRHQIGYVAEFRFINHQTQELETRIAELHKTLIGQVPAVTELNFLEKVKWLDMYGVDLHPVLGEDNVEYFLGLTPSGVIVLRNKTKVGNYFWPRITKVYFKGKYFMLRVRDKNNDESTYGFELPSKQACKHLWKCSVEHHAFFRLTQVSSTNCGKTFTLASRFRYSGRTERQVQSELQQQNRLQPRVTRVASRRYQRRLGQPDGIDSSLKEDSNKENEKFETRSNLSIPQPINLPSIYKSTSMPNSLPLADSPRSTRSAPWEDPRQRGLFSSSTNPSPRSVRSAGYKPSSRCYGHHRSPSVESEDSCDSRRKRHHHHHHHHRSQRGSDNDSERSQGSKCSHSHSQSRKHRSGSRNLESGSESESSQKHRHRSRKHKSSSNYELVDSEAQWKEVQRQQKAGQQVRKPQSAVIRDLSAAARKSGYMNSGMESESEASFMHRRKHRKHRSRSRSPSDNRKCPPEELKRHFEYQLVEPSGMSNDQLKDIPYTKVETEAKPFKVKFSPNTRHKQRTGTSRSSKSNASSDQKSPLPLDDDDGPPPPYTPNPHLGMSLAITKPSSTSSPTSSTGSNTLRKTMTNGYHSLDLLPKHCQPNLNGNSGLRTMQSTNQNSEDGILRVNGLAVHHEHSDSGLGTEGHDAHGSSSGHTTGSYNSSASQSPNHMGVGISASSSLSSFSSSNPSGPSLSQHMAPSTSSHAIQAIHNLNYGDSQGQLSQNHNGHFLHHGHYTTATATTNSNNNNGAWYTSHGYHHYPNNSLNGSSNLPINHGHTAVKPPLPLSNGGPHCFNQPFTSTAHHSSTMPNFQKPHSNTQYPAYYNQRTMNGLVPNGNAHLHHQMNVQPILNSPIHHNPAMTVPLPMTSITNRPLPEHPISQNHDNMSTNPMLGKMATIGHGAMPNYQSRQTAAHFMPSHTASYQTNGFHNNYAWTNCGSLERGMLVPQLETTGIANSEIVRQTENNNHEMSTEL